ncbi:MAG TPA: hydroxyacid dehydrogenase [Phycisphaerae bacterium]|jgi:D-3-phosphoglycerate dehydrogenase
MPRPLIVVAEPYEPTAVAKLRAVGEVRALDDCSEESLLANIAEAEALLVRTYAPVTARVIAAARKLKVIGRGGVGLENIDTAAAARAGITVVYTPAAATRAVAELTIGLMLALERRMYFADAEVRAGHFIRARNVLRGRELGDLTLGIVGMGRIGRTVARIARIGFGMQILYNDIVEITGLDFEATRVEKDRLWSEADVISLHLPLTPQTANLIDAGVLAKFKRSSLLINTARGGIVDSAALADALRAGRLAGAAIDVFDVEPPPVDHPLLNAPNVVLSPHSAARTAPALARMNDCVDDVIAVLAGRCPQFAFVG